MAHERIDVDLPLAKVYEYLSDPTYFPHFFERIDHVNKVNSQTFEFATQMGGKDYQWTTNIIDNLRNTRFAWITINGNLNQTGTIRFTPLDNGERTRVDFSLDYRTFFGEPEEELAEFIQALPAQMKKDLQRFKEEAEADTFKQNADDTLEEIEAADEAEEEEAAA
ncbi:SRPBCC family protein [Aliifodinibius salicampi]|uniref:SRPBCC family protein n=1 Tax=Fodinibius salicampi TaxID=1920655 RepID=A0ABT3PW58_9BACT|nr:SRPBCC family protein [Fodinibius salicampi]MCW9712089.1 SRPBCC family protein [Fodinibius salicampi]